MFVGPHSPDPMMHANKGPLPPPPPVSSWIHDVSLHFYIYTVSHKKL